jgi:glycosyltransferase involved in cell wall biosynthesis
MLEDNSSNLPFVSVCTPTYNRRAFINIAINCFNDQTYPKELIEWIILDDGTDKIEDLVIHIPQVKYFKYDTKMTISKKRNIMNYISKGDIIIYMDDDDYNPPNRIENTVKILKENKNILCVGSSILYTYFFRLGEIWKFGPLFENHSTAGTLGFKKELLNITSFNENDTITEEKYFLKNYTIPLIQLDPLKTIICFSHNNNTFDKELLIKNPLLSKANKTNLNINNLISNNYIKEFLNQQYLLYSKKENKINNKNNITKKSNSIKNIKTLNTNNKIKTNKFNNNRNYTFNLFV